MFNKLMKGKRGTRKVPRSDANEPARSRAGVMASSATVNHVSRAAAPASSSQVPSSSAPSTVSPAQFEQLPLFRDVPSSDDRVTAITNLFLRKLRICSIIFDFSDCLRSPREKEAKRQTLLELVDFIQSNNCGRLPENVQAELVRTVSVNIFRGLPPAAHENTGTVDTTADPEEEETYLDPAWPHLQLIYELLLRYIISTDTDTKVAKRFVNHSFILKLLDLFESEDAREREYLKTIVHRIYGKFMVHRPLIRNANNNIFYRFAFETERHSGVVELLEILGSIISGFAMPMKEEHKLFLVRALIPLHKPKTVGVYHSQLTYCITLFVEKDYKLADPVIRGLLKYWPVTNCQKEVLFIGELEEVLEATHPAEFRRFMVPLFKQIARCLNSAHFQVAERALFLWNNDHIVDLIAQNRSVIFPIIFEALERNIQNHWNQAVNGLTANVRKMFQEMDGKLFEECRSEYVEKETKAREIEEKRQLAWRQLETFVENQTMNCC